MIKNHENIPAFLRAQGYVRLLEAGRDLRVYYFSSNTGEKVKIYLRNDGSFCVAPLEGAMVKKSLL